jgi:integrase
LRSQNINKPGEPLRFGKGSFGHRLSHLISQHSKTAANGKKVVSFATQEKREAIIWLCFRELKEGGYKLPDPQSFANRHMTFLAQKWEADSLSASTIQNRISILRVFAEWIGKPGMILAPEKYVSNPESVSRTYAAQHDKSWEAANVDAEAVIRQVTLEDIHAANQIKAVLAFGLRRKEAVMLRPRQADRGTYLSVSDGTKGGRDRTVPIDTPFKRKVLDELKQAVTSEHGHLGNPSMELAKNLRRLTYVMEKHGLTKKDLGVTLHGLRHQYLNRRFEAIAGMPSPIRGGEITAENAEEAGHARISITAAYYGPLGRSGSKRSQ